MGLLALGIVLVVAGLLLAFTNVLGLAPIGDNLVWLGWVVFAVGVVLAIVSFVMGRRTVVYDRRRTW